MVILSPIWLKIGIIVTLYESDWENRVLMNIFKKSSQISRKCALKWPQLGSNGLSETSEIFKRPKFWHFSSDFEKRGH